MSEHTVVKISDVPDQGPNFGLEGKYELRFLRDQLGCENCGVTYSRLASNFQLPFGHKHKRQEEIYLLVSGSAELKVGDDIVPLEPWTAVRVPSDTMRSLRAGAQGAEFVVVGAPNTGPGDAAVQQGWWSG